MNARSSSYVRRTTVPPENWRLPLISRLDIELTERCNNNCIHCCINRPLHDDGARAQEMPTSRIKEILTEAASLGTLTVRFTGGEPLIREDFEELYLYARRLGLRVCLFTNGRLITPGLAALFVRVPLREVIEITVYGMTQESYESVSGVKGSYEECRRGIDLLLENDVPFIVKGSVLPQNISEVPLFEDWATAIPAMDSPPSYPVILDLRSRRDLPRKNQLIKSLRLSPEEAVAFLSRDQERYRRSMAEFCAGFMGPSGDRLFSCGSGVGGCCVDATGRLQPCLLLRHPDVTCDLASGSLKTAMTEFFPKVREMKAENPDYLARCARCFLGGLCEQCPAKSWSEHGTLDTPVEYLCEVAHCQARDLGLLKEGEMGWEVSDWKQRVSDLVKKAGN